MIPNAITALALCLGLTGVSLAIRGEWDKALGAIVLAGVLDGLDGRIARLLRAQSNFGAELDSLSDNIAFGTAPALILFLWSLQTAPRFGWLAALALAVCCALRLARFNARLDAAEQPHKSAGFNTGVPAPAGAGLAFVPIYLWLITGNDALPRLAAGDGLDAVHRRADDLEPADLQLVEHPHPAALAAVRAGRHCVARRGADRRAVADVARGGRSLPADDPGRAGELCQGQAAARQPRRGAHRLLQPRPRVRTRMASTPAAAAANLPLRAAAIFAPLSSRTAAPDDHQQPQGGEEGEGAKCCNHRFDPSWERLTELDLFCSSRLGDRSGEAT